MVSRPVINVGNDDNYSAILGSHISLGSSRRTLFDTGSSRPSIRSSPKSLSSYKAFCLACNFISVGYLFVPWAFATTGLVLTTIIFLAVMLQSFITCSYVMEACARAEVLASTPQHISDEKPFENEDIYLVEQDYPKEETEVCDLGSSLRSSSFLRSAVEGDEPRSSSTLSCPNPDVDSSLRVNSSRGVTDEPTASSGLKQQQDALSFEEDDAALDMSIGNTSQRNDKTDLMMAPRPCIGSRTFELSELSRIFLGNFWRCIFTFTSCCDLYGVTWSVGAVFASSLASKFAIRENQDDYIIFVAIFALIVIPMCYVPIVDQVYVQLGFFATRMLMVLIMLITVSMAYGSAEPHFGEIIHDGTQNTTTVANFQSFHLGVQVCIFSTAYQFSVPVVAEISRYKKSMGKIYASSTAFIAISVVGLSILLASYFGSEFMEESSNLNWATYHGGTGIVDEDTGERIHVAWWASVISNFVVIYPAIDGISFFVLCSVSLGSILQGAWYGEAIHTLGPSWKRSVFFCLLSSIPQLVGAILVRDLSMIANYTGLFTVASYTILPCLLEISSSRILRKEGKNPKTHYHTIFSNELSAWTVVSLGLVSIVYTVVASQLLVQDEV